MSDLTRERIEEYRREWTSGNPEDTEDIVINALCDMALRCEQQAKRIAHLEEKADAIHKYLLAKNDMALIAIITELSLDAERRALLPRKVEA